MASHSGTDSESDSDISCSPQQIENLCKKIQSNLHFEKTNVSTSSESDSREKILPKHAKSFTGSTSETDSSQNGENLASLQTKTSGWNLCILQSLGIYYNDSYHSSPIDILYMIFEELKIFGPLTDDQIVDCGRLQQCIKFSSSINDVVNDKEKIVQNKEGDIFLPGLEEDISNAIATQSKVEDFLLSLQMMISCHIAFSNGLRDTGVPEAMFVDILKSFAKMCHFLPVPVSAKKSSTVKSSSDFVIIPNKFRKCAFAMATSCIVSIVEVKQLRRWKVNRADHRKTRVTRSSKDSKDSGNDEPDVSWEPPICQKVHEMILAQHGAKLLMHNDIYGSILSKGRIWKYLPGMICIGTEVIFTLLKIKGKHLKELTTMSKTDTIKQDTKATIYYSEPKDLLKKEDRDVLIESFLRLDNIGNTKR